jgi:hypothetical protein
MNIIVSKVYDIERFAWFMHLKYGFNLSYIKMLSTCISEKDKYSFINLTEVEVRYLQASICKLKIINLSKMPLARKIKKPSSIDISPQPGDESKQEQLELFHVKFTKVIHFDEMLNERQIQALLKDKYVKSINIDK